jgi:hypothetical protein
MKASQEKMNAEMKVRAEARQEKGNAEMKASQERVSAEMKAVQAEIKAAYAETEARAEACHERFLARLDGLTSHGKGTTTCQTETTSSPEEMKDAIKMEINPEETQTAVQCLEFQMEEAGAENIGSSEDRFGYQRLAVRRRQGAERSGPKTVLGPGRSRLLPASESYAAPSLQCARDICVKVQARTVLRGEPIKEGGSRIYDREARNAISALGTEADEEDIRQGPQDAHAAGGGESNN